MSGSEEFDELYLRARSQLLLETFALTGDLTAARSAVRDGFVILMHHWRKANRQGDPIGWMRQSAWDRAHRHHQTHVWQRDPDLPDHVRSVLAALSVLPAHDRKALVGAWLAHLGGDELTRAVGLPQAQTAAALDRATDDVATLLEISPDEVPTTLQSLSVVTDLVEWPRESLVRSAGTARRRTHSVVGAVAAAAVVALAGTVVSVGTHDRANLDAERVSGTPTVAAEETALLDDERLLQVPQVGPVATKLTWTVAATTDNEGANPIMAPCMQDRFADQWAGIDGSVRRFTGTGPAGQSGTVTQFVELSHSVATARRTYQRVRTWYGACKEPRFQLLDTEQISGVGADGIQFRFLDWKQPERQVTVNVARSGRLTIATVDELTGVKKPGGPQASAQVLADAVDQQCASDVGTECAITPRLTAIAPLRFGKPVGMLKELDMPPVKNAPGPWVATPEARATKVSSASACATGTYGGAGTTKASARSFVFPEITDKKSTFGMTQAVAAMTPAAAKKFVQGFVDRMATCTDDEMGTKVTQLRLNRTKKSDLAVWRVTVDLGEDKTLDSLVAMARIGDRVTQLVFTPDSKHTMAEADFLALAARAQQRVVNYAAKAPAATTAPSPTPSPAS